MSRRRRSSGDEARGRGGAHSHRGGGRLSGALGHRPSQARIESMQACSKQSISFHNQYLQYFQCTNTL